MTKEELAKKYNVTLDEIEKAFLVSDSEFAFCRFNNIPTPESLCEHWYGDKTIPPVWRTE